VAGCERAEQLLRSRSTSHALVCLQASAVAPSATDKAYKGLSKIASAQARKPAKKRVAKTTGAGRTALDGISGAALKAGCMLIGTSGPSIGIMRRGALGQHLEHLVMEDAVLSAQGTADLSRDELLEACIDRGFGSGTLPDAKLRKGLNEWLAVARSRTADGNVAFEPHRLRLCMMASFAAAAVRREDESMSVLPRLAYS